MILTNGKLSIISLKASIVVEQFFFYFYLKLNNYVRVFFDSNVFLGFYGNTKNMTKSFKVARLDFLGLIPTNFEH